MSSSFDELAKGTSLEAFLKMADEDSDEGEGEDAPDGEAHAEFEVDVETGEEYIPFGSLYGASNAAVTAVLEAAEKAAAAAAEEEVETHSPDASGGASAPPSSPYSPVQKSNTTSSLFVSSTMSDPDVTEMLSCVSLLLHHHMAAEVGRAPVTPPPAYEFAEDDSALSPDEIPELEDISSFLTKTFRVAKWSPECHIMALVFVNRLTGYTSIRLHNSNWRPILLCSLLLAQKLWDDKSLANIDFPYIWKKAMPSSSHSKISLARVNFMERKFLELLQYNVNVKSSLYAKYYFELRTLREGAFPLQALKPHQARHLEARSAAFETAVLSMQEKEKALDRGSKTLAAAPRSALSGMLV